MPCLRIALLLCFVLSGFSGLVFEVVWSRLLVHIFGASLPAVSTVLSVFMGGLAAGAYLGGRLWTGKDPPIVYAVLELAIGAYALAVPFLLSQSVLEPVWLGLHGQFSGSPLVLSALRLLLSTLVLAMPTTFMGATFTVISRFLSACSSSPARDIGYLYALNTLGAVAGAIIGGFVMVPALGLSGSVQAAALVNIVVAVVVLTCRRLVAKPTPADWGTVDTFTSANKVAAEQSPGGAPAVMDAGVFQPGRAEIEDSRAGRLDIAVTLPAVASLLSIAACTGALFMILEVTWTRFFSLVFGSTTYAFSIVLALVLAGLAAGSWGAAALSARSRLLLALLSLGQLISGLYLYATLLFVNEIPWWFLELTQVLSQKADGATFANAVAARALIAAGIILPPSIMSGGVFPLSVRLLAGGRSTTGVMAGKLFAANTAGAIAGAWVAGFVLVPKLGELFVSGIQATILAVAVLELCLGAVILFAWLKGAAPGVRPHLLSAICVVFSAGLITVLATARQLAWDPAVLSSGVSFYSAITSGTVSREQFLKAVGARDADYGQAMPETLFYREGLNTTVTVGTNPSANVTFLKNDGKVEASVPTHPGQPAPYCDAATHVLLGMLPVLIQSNPVASTFLLGYGSGTTAGATLASPSVKRLTIAELEEAVVAADKFFNQSNGSPLREEWKRSGRVRMLVADGRSILTGSRDKFDVIISQPGDAWVNGMTDLFTREFWSVAASRLKPGGLMAQWIQLYSITPEYLGILLRTFRDAFPYSLMFHPPGSGELILVGSREPVEIDVKKLAARIKEPEVARILSETGVRTSADILAMLVKGAPEFSAFCDQLARDSGDNRLNTDDNLLTEYQLPRQLFSTPGILPANIKAIQGRDLDMLAALKNYGETASEKAQTLSALALAFARLAADPDLKLFYEKQALRLAEQATALDFSPATLQAKAQVKEMLGRGDKRGQSR